MASTGHSPHRLKHGEPGGYRERHQILLQLQYKLANGKPEFSYRTARATIEEEGLLPERVEHVAWSRFMSRQEFVAALDIGIDDDSRVTVETVGDDFLWSLATDAVMTQEIRTNLYGELRYWNGGQWLPREDFDQASCSRMRFKAKKNGASQPERHKFSYNVIYRDDQGAMVEFEIDPDIKNPSS